MQNPTGHIRSLDLCRGLAALVVLFYHMDFLLFGTQVLFHRGYLCVDFFFLLSGYVIAHSYEGKLQSGLTNAQFAVLRFARLWPLVALTTIIGLLVQIPRWHREPGGIDAVALVATVLCNVFMLPAPTSPNQFLFPLNGAAWSIFFEMVANLAYAWFLPVLNKQALTALVVASGLALGLVVLTQNTLDVGWARHSFALGFPRVFFSFFLGVLVYRHHPALRIALTSNPTLLLSGLALACIAINIPSSPQTYLNGLCDFLIVVSVFPVVLILAIETELGSRSGRIAWLLGGISYAVYLLQTPLVIGYSGIPQLFSWSKIGHFVPWAGIVFIVLCLPIAYLTWRFFELPAQRRLRASLLGRKAAESQVLRVAAAKK